MTQDEHVKKEHKWIDHSHVRDNVNHHSLTGHKPTASNDEYIDMNCESVMFTCSTSYVKRLMILPNGVVSK